MAEVRAGVVGLRRPRWRLQPLLDRYGSLIQELIDLADADPELWASLIEAPEYLRVEIVHAVGHEGAPHLEAERDSQRAPGDTEANAERLAAPDIRRSPAIRSHHSASSESENSCQAASSQ